MSKQASKGHSFQNQQSNVKGRQQPAFDVLMRTLMGQMAQPPETPISVPSQQAVSLMQAGLPAAREALGLGGGLAARLGGESGGGQMLPESLRGILGASASGAGAAAPQWGLQSREQLGIPERRSQMGPWLPTPAELEAIGAVPDVRPVGTVQKGRQRMERLEGRIERRQAKGKKTGRAERKLERLQQRIGY